MSNPKNKCVRIIGYSSVKYDTRAVRGHNSDFYYVASTDDKAILFCESENKKYQIELYTIDGPCPSGWIVATWGMLNVKEVEEFEYVIDYRPVDSGPMTMTVPIQLPNMIEFDVGVDYRNFANVIKNEYFEISKFGNGGKWYPSGYYKIFMNKFVKVG